MAVQVIYSEIETPHYNEYAVECEADAYEFEHKAFFIAGLCTCGARFYSEKLDWKDASDRFYEYIDLVDYYDGGGVVYLYAETCQDYFIIKSFIVT